MTNTAKHFVNKAIYVFLCFYAGFNSTSGCTISADGIQCG